MEITDLKSAAMLLTRYYTIQKIARTFKGDTAHLCDLGGCKTARGQS